MKKFIPVIIFLIIFAPLFYQWNRAEERADLLDMRKYNLEKEVAMINMVQNRGELAFEEETAKLIKLVDKVRKRLPFIPVEYAFAEDLIERFKEKNIEIKYIYSSRKNTDFYQHVDLVFTYSEEKYNDVLFQEIFKNIDRLVKWSVNTEDKVLMITIYGFSYDFTPRVKACAVSANEKLNYWPFNSMIRDRGKLVKELCSKRNKKEWVLIKIRQYEQIKRYLEMGFAILKQLDPDWKKNMEPVEQDPIGRIPIS